MNVPGRPRATRAFGELMPPDLRHQRELEATLRQIRTFQKRASENWRLEIPLWRLAVEGLATFVLAFMTGLGLAVLYQVFTT